MGVDFMDCFLFIFTIAAFYHQRKERTNTLLIALDTDGTKNASPQFNPETPVNTN